MAREELVRGLPAVGPVDQLCEACLAGKQKRSPFPQQGEYRARRVLELVHSELCGPIAPETPNGSKYFLLLVDDRSRYMWVAMLPSKDRAAVAIKEIKARAEGESGLKLGAFRTDRGGEFTSHEFAEYCAGEGIHREHTAPYSPQQNGIAKGLPGWFWGEAVATAVYILNRCPTKSVDGMTPFEVWHGKKPAVHHLKVFGCIAYVLNMTPHLKKLEDRGRKMIFIGYEYGSKAYRAYDPTARRVHVTRDVVFDENAQWDWGSGAEQGDVGSHDDMFTLEYAVGNQVPPELDGAIEVLDDDAPGPEPMSPPSVHYSGGAASIEDGGEEVEFTSPPSVHIDHLDANHDDAPLRFRKIDNIVGLASPRGLASRVLIAKELHAVSSDEPVSFVEAEGHPSWRKAMEEEMASIEENRTWSLVDLPHGRRAIGLKWVYKVKRDENGAVAKYKARLVVKGYAQRQGIDYDEVFAPVAQLDTVRLLIALAAHEGWEVHHMDVKLAFLNGDLKEEVYVEQPAGFISTGNEHKVLKLKKALYGLHQAPRAWNAKLDETLLSFRFRRSPSEHAIYTKWNGEAQLVVGVYVDDLVIIGASCDDIKYFKKEMADVFKMSDLGLLRYYLGIERSIVGSLRYLVNTRPDLAFAVGYVSRFLEEPRKDHLAAVKQILRYVAGTKSWGLRYERKKEKQVQLTGFSDSDFAGDVDARKSTTGVIFFLANSPITWQSMKQKVVAQSSCEAEYIAAANAACQGVWLARVLAEVHGSAPSVPMLKVDNKSAIALIKNSVLHGHSKHIEVKYHLVRESAEKGQINVEFIRSEEQLGDVLTKPLGKVKFHEFRAKIGLVDVRGKYSKAQEEIVVNGEPCMSSTSFRVTA
ncbi:unnamed protein product [Spirodela intermedia]|uniref:Integrase catalytic domain-containing protein n=1 Tax=Spirodela intermedia TaxID=51605 RepID=A0A7I8KSK5_SPIIN|nr:unnamed protein product [Spirodela intermedia]